MVRVTHRRHLQRTASSLLPQLLPAPLSLRGCFVPAPWPVLLLARVRRVDLYGLCLYNGEAVALLRKLREVEVLRLDCYHLELDTLRYVSGTVQKLVLNLADEDSVAELSALLPRFPLLSTLTVKVRNRVESRVLAAPQPMHGFSLSDFALFTKVKTSGCLMAARHPTSELLHTLKIRAVPENPSLQLSLSDSTLTSLSAFPRLQHLTITDFTSCSSQLTDKGISTISRNWPHIRTLRLSSHSEEAVRNVSDLSLMRLFSLCTELEDLALDSFKMMTDAAVAELTASCSRISALSLDYTNITGEALTMIEGCGMRLRRLSLKGCRRVREEGLLELLATQSELERLNLSCTGGVTDAVVETIRDVCTSLTELTLNEALITSPTLSVISDISTLQSLAVNFCHDIDSFSYLETFSGLTQLVRLALVGYPDLRDEEVRWACGASTHSLARVRLDGCTRLSDDTLTFLVTQCKKLQVLYMSGCSITAEGVAALPPSLRNLKLLSVGLSRASFRRRTFVVE